MYTLAIKIARVNIQWNPGRDIIGNKLVIRSLQIGISRHLINEFNEEWIIEIEDILALVNKIYALKVAGNNPKRFCKRKNL